MGDKGDMGPQGDKGGIGMKGDEGDKGKYYCLPFFVTGIVHMVYIYVKLNVYHSSI